MEDKYKEYAPNNFSKVPPLFFLALMLLSLSIWYYYDNKYVQLYFLVLGLFMLYKVVKNTIKHFGCECCRSIIKVYSNKIVYSCGPTDYTINKTDVKKVTRKTFKKNKITGITLKDPKKFVAEASKKFVKTNPKRNLCRAIIIYFSSRKFDTPTPFKKIYSTKLKDVEEVNYKVMMMNHKLLDHHTGFIEIFYVDNPYPAMINPKKVWSDEMYNDIKKALT